MQKHFIRYSVSFLILGFTALSLNSCVKSYVCKCDVSYEGRPGLPAGFSKEYDIKDSKTTAENACRSASKESTEMGITTIEKCDLD